MTLTVDDSLRPPLVSKPDRLEKCLFNGKYDWSADQLQDREWCQDDYEPFRVWGLNQYVPSLGQKCTVLFTLVCQKSEQSPTISASGKLIHHFISSVSSSLMRQTTDKCASEQKETNVVVHHLSLFCPKFLFHCIALHGFRLFESDLTGNFMSVEPF